MLKITLLGIVGSVSFSTSFVSLGQYVNVDEPAAARRFRRLKELSREFKDAVASPLVVACRQRLGLSPPRGSVLALPDELILCVLTWASAQDLCRLARSSRKMRRLAEDKELWRVLFYR